MSSFDLQRFRQAYSSFLGAHPERVLLTGHSHQAWPDVARDAMNRYFDDSARLVDDKWGRVFEIVERVGERINRRLGFDPKDPIAFGKSTHELVFRLLSCFPKDARVVTTTGEFHSLYRQLRRLEEDGLRVTWVDATRRDALCDELLAAIQPGVSVVAVSAVLFEDSFVLPRLAEIVARASEVGAIPLVDAYHAFNVLEPAWGAHRGPAFVVAGGYKYAAFGEGLCFMRFSPHTTLRPAYTGWFADFGALEGARDGRPTSYGEGGARFAGSTFDASAFYRADAVLAHLDAFGLDVPALRAISLRQTSLLRDRALASGLDVVAPADPERRGGFVSVRVVQAPEVARALRDRDVWVDARGDILRMGPAPYLTDEELERGVAAVAEAARTARPQSR